MTRVLFVDSMPKLRLGSSLLRSYQLCELAKAGLDASGIPSAVTSSFKHRNSILILNKNTLLNCTQEQLYKLRGAGNVLFGDPLDGKIDGNTLAACHVLLASSRTQTEQLRESYPEKRIAYVGHHVDLRIGNVTPSDDTLQLAYFGDILNAAFAEQLEKEVSFIHVDTSQADNVQWMKLLHQFNAHYALREHHKADGLKPFTKGFIAAHCACPVLIDIKDEEARRFLPEGYPYVVTRSSPDGVIEVTCRMRAGFGGPEWNEAMGFMRDLKQASSRAVVIEQFREALAPELSDRQRKSFFPKLGSWLRRTVAL